MKKLSILLAVLLFLGTFAVSITYLQAAGSGGAGGSAGSGIGGSGSSGTGSSDSLGTGSGVTGRRRVVWVIQDL